MMSSEFYCINNICEVLSRTVNEQLEDMYFTRIIRLVKWRKSRSLSNVKLMGERLGVET
jgi:hypothetical protein